MGEIGKGEDMWEDYSGGESYSTHHMFRFSYGWPYASIWWTIQEEAAW